MIALKLDSGDVVWMDAVLSFSESYSASVTKHQIESGSSISDHIIQDNAKFTISGVITNVDFNRTFDYTNIPTDASNSAGGANAGKELNLLNTQPKQIEIKSPLTNPLVKLLPDSIRQFVGSDSPPEVVIGTTPETQDILLSESLLKSMINGSRQVDAKGKVSYKREIILITEYNPDFSIKNSFDNCVCTNMSFSQAPESGDALYPQMSFEQVRYVTLTTTTFSSNTISSGIKNKGADKAQKGSQSTATGDATGAAAEQNPKVARSAYAKIKGITGGFKEGDVE
jgi:hypothetical protein